MKQSSIYRKKFWKIHKEWDDRIGKSSGLSENQEDENNVKDSKRRHYED